MDLSQDRRRRGYLSETTCQEAGRYGRYGRQVDLSSPASHTRYLLQASCQNDQNRASIDRLPRSYSYYPAYLISYRMPGFLPDHEKADPGSTN